jgi:hypothetical protein
VLPSCFKRFFQDGAAAISQDEGDSGLLVAMILPAVQMVRARHLTHRFLATSVP